MNNEYHLSYVIMPFGKYKDEYIGDIPNNYLEWLYDNVELNGKLREAVSYVLDLENDD